MPTTNESSSQSKRKRRRHFAVTFTELGFLGRPMVKLSGVPAYVEATRDLKPQVGEKWVVAVRYQDAKRIILDPVKKCEE